MYTHLVDAWPQLYKITELKGLPLDSPFQLMTTAIKLLS